MGIRGWYCGHELKTSGIPPVPKELKEMWLYNQSLVRNPWARCILEFGLFQSLERLFGADIEH